jgi:hypothetical protein
VVAFVVAEESAVVLSGFRFSVVAVVPGLFSVVF